MKTIDDYREKAIKALQKAGWTIKSQKGSHVKLVKPGVRRTIIIPVHKGKALDRGLLFAIIKHSELSVEKFKELL